MPVLHQRMRSYRKKPVQGQITHFAVRRTGELETLYEITTKTSQSSDLREILEYSLKKSLAAINIDRGGIYLLDDRTGLLKIAVQFNLDESLVERIENLHMGEGFSGQVAQTGRPLVIQDIAGDLRLTRKEVVEAGLHSLAVVPIQTKGKILGTLFAITSGYRDFQQWEVNLLTSIGSQIGVAIENSRLLANIQRQLAQLAALQETSRAVVSTLDLDALLELIIQQATNLLQADGGMLNLVDWESKEDEVFPAPVRPGGHLGSECHWIRVFQDGLPCRIARKLSMR